MPRSSALVAGAVVVATLPYLALKAAWLAGSPVGLTDPEFLAAPGILVGNVVTAALDLVAVALAIGLARGTGRLPAWMIVVPGWVGVGFLVPIAVTTAPALLLDALAGTTAGGPEPLVGWVQPLVYLGFTVQGVGLALLLAWEVRRRWPGILVPAGPLPWVRTLAALAVVPAGALVVLHVADAAALTPEPWTVGGAVVDLVRAALVGAGVLGMRAVAAGGRGIAALCAAALGSASAFAWGLYAAMTTLGATAFAAGPLTGLAALIGALLGLALAMGTLACVAGTGSVRG